MRQSTTIAFFGLTILLLVAGCTASGGAAPGLQASSYPAGNDPNDHSTAATGFGLGPENFNSNGGAFGPDQASGGHH